MAGWTNCLADYLTANISTTVPGSLEWKIDIDPSIIATSAQFHFRLIVHSEPAVHALTRPRLPRRGFVINSVSISTTSSSSTTTASSLASSSASATPASSSGANSTGSSGSTSNIGSIAGGVVGGLAGLALLCGIALLLLRRAKQNRKSMIYDKDGGVEGSCIQTVTMDAPSGFVPGHSYMGVPSELDSGATTQNELQGSTPREWH